MGQLARAAVDGEAENKLTAVLKDTKRFIAYEAGDKEAVESEPEAGIVKRIVTNKYFIFIIVLGLVIALVLWFTRKDPKKQ